METTYYAVFLYEKMFIMVISYNFLYVVHYTNFLYNFYLNKKFFIYRNCMIKSCGQHGSAKKSVLAITDIMQ